MLRQIVRTLSRQPGGSIPQRSEGWSAPKLAYDFWDNERVAYAALIQAEREAPLTRCAPEALVLCIQGTTVINLTR